MAGKGIDMIGAKMGYLNQDSCTPNSPGELVPLYTVSQVAGYLGVHPHTIYRYLQEGRIRAVRIGQTYRFTAQDINEYIAECSIDNS